MKYLHEIFDKSYKFGELSTDRHGSTHARFNSPKGEYSAFAANKHVNNAGGYMSAQHSSEGKTADISFDFSNPDMHTDDPTGLEGSESHKIFSSIKTVLKHHLKANPHVTHVMFSSKDSDGGRTKLYHHIAKKIDPNYKSGPYSNSETYFHAKADRLK
jgi:hypothetical protein